MLRIIWAAMLGGVVAYTVVIFALMRAGIIDIGSLDPSIMNVAGAVMLFLMVGGVLARRSMVARIPMDAPDEERLARYQVATIVGFALCEGGGIVLIVLAMITDAPTWVLTGGGAAAFLLFMARPTGEEVGLD